MSKEGLELLSPAGNLDIFKSVIGAGADAVYFGGEAFGARAYAPNFTMDEGKEAIRYAHLYGRKAYLTVNTLLKNKEIEQQLYDYIRAYYENGIDAVIVQDIGVLDFIHTYFPELAIHASTQMTITDAYGAEFVMHKGVSRVVTARELSMAELSDIYRKTGVEIETFVHGALCVSYSGQCLMSSMLGGRSGNRGRCAQPCRLPYQLSDEQGHSCDMPGDYLLSLKDLCGIDRIRELSEAGVYSFKIEGRMKQIAYATGVVALYRKYMDAYLEGKRVVVSEKDHKRLFDLGNRNGFTDVYYDRQNRQDMMTYTKPSHEKTIDDSDTMTEPKILLFGVCRVHKGQPLSLEVETEHQIRCSMIGERVLAADKHPVTRAQIEEKLQKTGNTPFCFRQLYVDVDEDAFVPMGAINELRRKVLGTLQEIILTRDIPRPVDWNPQKERFSCVNESQDSEQNLLVVCSTDDQFQTAVTYGCVRRIAVSLELLCWNNRRMMPEEWVKQNLNQYLQQASDAGKDLYVMIPLICRQKEMELFKEYAFLFRKKELVGMIACSYDVLGFLEHIHYPERKIITDYRIYTFSNVSVRALRKYGYDDQCAPLELNYKELRHRYNGCSYMLIYGRIPLMLTATCQNANAHGCNKTVGLHFLQDRYREQLPVKNVCAFCYNEIYNSKVYNLMSEHTLLQELGFLGYRIDFSLESAEEVAEVLDQYASLFVQANSDTKYIQADGNITKGHFKRGVE